VARAARIAAPRPRAGRRLGSDHLRPRPALRRRQARGDRPGGLLARRGRLVRRQPRSRQPRDHQHQRPAAGAAVAARGGCRVRRAPRLDRGALESSSPGAVSSAAGKARRRSKGGPFQGGATKAAVEKPSPAGSSSRHLGLVRCRGRRALEVPWRFDGADDRVGPNYTGQPAVTSVYS
jgi:hypothetical protein